MPDTMLDLDPTFATNTDALLPLGARVAGLGLGSVDYLADTIVLDARAAELFDLAAHTPIPRDMLHAQIHPEDLAGVEAQVAAMLRPEHPDFIDVVHRIATRDGSERWVSARKQVMFDTNGTLDRKPVSGLVAIMDVTAHKVSEARVQDLMHEMNHRLKNLLTVVQSIARMTARTGDMQDFMPRFDARLRALSQNQDLLLSRGMVSVTLGALIRQQIRAFTGGAEGRVTVDGPDLPLRFEAIQPIGLALHELATNATKYGALSVPAGRLSVTWACEGDRFKMSWIESGGPEVAPPKRTGFGSTVLQAMVRSALSADVTLDYDPNGLQWSIACDAGQIRDNTPL